jgi:cell division protein FtsB
VTESNNGKATAQKKLHLNDRKIVQWSIIVCAIIVVTLSLIGDKGFLQLISLKQQEKNLQREIAELQTEREEWIHKIDSLKKKQSYIETIAREQLGMVKNYEFLYLFELERTE